jgi:TetR/AcrR family transcriptional repressor of nem operon
LLDRAMHFFWEHGFGQASIDELVREVGTSRHTLYQQFGGKLGLYSAVLDRYSETVVSGALSAMQRGSTPTERIGNYFEHLVRAAQRQGTLGRGCLMANTMAELGSTEHSISPRLLQHVERITQAVAAAIEEAGVKEAPARAQAELLTTFAQGLWLRARAGAECNNGQYDQRTYGSQMVCVPC